MLTDEELLALAGAKALARGRAYHRGGRIALSALDTGGLRGEAEGQHTYRLQLRRAEGGWRWQCDCPAAAGGDFCKHLVAAVLTARDGAGEQADSPPPPPDALATWLRAQDSARLAGWLLALAEEDPQVRRRLALHQAGDDPAALKPALARMLTLGGFLDQRRTADFAAGLDHAIAALHGACQRNPVAGRLLCEYTAGRLLRLLERCDDSYGRLGQQLARIAELHAAACRAAAPGKALVKPLLALQALEEWELFPIAAYWDALGAEGQRGYGMRVMADFDASRAAGDVSRWGIPGAAERRAEAFARASGDVDLLLRILGHDVSESYRWLRLVEAMREHGRAREALARAEQAVARFPHDDRLRHALADCLAEAGLDNEARDHAWQAYREHPSAQNWDALKQRTDADWPRWREQALAHLASTERDHATARVLMLLHDGDTAGAAAVATAHPVRVEILPRLARAMEATSPVEAAIVYLRIAQHLARNPQPMQYEQIVHALGKAARHLPVAAWHPVAAQIRAGHGRKRKLLALLDAAGL